MIIMVIENSKSTNFSCVENELSKLDKELDNLEAMIAKRNSSIEEKLAEIRRKHN